MIATTPGGSWLSVIATALILFSYEWVLIGLQRRDPRRIARSLHASLREQWFQAVGDQPGAELLAVQTLRNSLMSATMLASTTAIALMGSITLAAPAWHASIEGVANSPALTPRAVLDLLLVTLLFASLFATLMAVRYYHHVSFIAGLPAGSGARRRWAPLGQRYVRLGGLCYGIGLRQLVLVAPVVVGLLFPVAAPFVAALLCLAIWRFDRLAADDSPPVPSG